MSTEVEIKFRSADHDDLAGRLLDLGAREDPAIEQVDQYLAHPSRDFRESGEALRLRRIGPEIRITYKGPRHPGPTKTREEIEIPFAVGPESREAPARLLEALGFRPVAEVRKHRRPFHLHWEGLDVEVVLDTAADLGTFAEVEAIAATEDRIAEAQEAVLALARRLGLDEVEPRSYLRMTLERRGG